MRCSNLFSMQTAMIAFLGFIAGVVLVADLGWGHRLWWFLDKIPAGDKLGHLILFGILAFLVNAALRSSQFRMGRLVVLRGSFYVLVGATLEEISQLFIASRSFDWGDLTADVVAVIIGGWLARMYVHNGGNPTPNSAGVPPST